MYAFPGMALQQGMPPVPPMRPMQQGIAQQPGYSGTATPWQPATRPQAPFPLAQMAAGVPGPPLPIKARGKALDPVPSAPGLPKFVLPSPEDLGVSVGMTKVASPQQPPPVPAPSAPMDWNQVHARMERLGVLRYEKERHPTSGGVRVMVLLPMADPKMGQPVEAIAATEAGAMELALERAEAWIHRR